MCHDVVVTIRLDERSSLDSLLALIGSTARPGTLRVLSQPAATCTKDFQIFYYEYTQSLGEGVLLSSSLIKSTCDMNYLSQSRVTVMLDDMGQRVTMRAQR